MGPNVLVALRTRHVQDLTLESLQAWLFGDGQRGLDPGNHGGLVLRCRKHIAEYAGFCVRTRRSQRDPASAGRLQQSGAEAEAVIVGRGQCLVDKHHGAHRKLDAGASRPADVAMNPPPSPTLEVSGPRCSSWNSRRLSGLAAVSNVSW